MRRDAAKNASRRSFVYDGTRLKMRQDAVLTTTGRGFDYSRMQVYLLPHADLAAPACIRIASFVVLKIHPYIL